MYRGTTLIKWIVKLFFSADEDKSGAEPATNHVNGDAESPDSKENVNDSNEVSPWWFHNVKWLKLGEK